MSLLLNHPVLTVRIHAGLNAASVLAGLAGLMRSPFFSLTELAREKFPALTSDVELVDSHVNGIAGVPCENAGVIDARIAELKASGLGADVVSHPISRPDYLEAEAVSRLLRQSRSVGTRRQPRQSALSRSRPYRKRRGHRSYRRTFYNA